MITDQSITFANSHSAFDIEINSNNISEGNDDNIFQSRKTKRVGVKVDNISVKKQKTDNYSFISSERDDIKSYITKNDKIKVLFCIDIPQEYIRNNTNFTQKKIFTSIRKDKWTFIFNHYYHTKQEGGKISLSIKAEKSNDISYVYNDQKHQSPISKVANSLFFSIDANVNVINFKSHSFNFPIIHYSIVETSPFILIPTEFYSNNSNKPIIKILIEFSIDKKFILNNLPYKGIYNEGATCYVNSMIQTLNSVSSFKKAVFQIPTEKDTYNSSVALSLQRLFYDLMTGDAPASARSLLRSFGWSKEQIQIQHDVQEFNLLLSDVMQNRMKGTACEGSFNRLFEGKLINYIQCVNVDYHSECVEKFVDLQLTIKKYKNLYESLDAYTEEEILDNENKYETEGYGKQKAKKGIKFVSFPPVLTLQLKRFEYNSKKELMVKINDYFEYSDEIDLSKYIDRKKEGERMEYKYILHSVVVHQGSANSGHYYAYIKPTVDSRDWLKFNDQVVLPADMYEIFHQNFGGNCEIYKHKGKGEIVLQSSNYERTAYILVYMRKSLERELVEEITLNSVPVYLRKRFDCDKEEEENSLKKKKRNNEHYNILLISNQNCFNHLGKLGIVNSFMDVNVDLPLIYNTSYRLLISFPKNSTFEELIVFISERTNIPISNMILYEYINCDNVQLLSRQDFDLQFIIPIQSTISEFKKENKKLFISLFLYIKGDYTLLSTINSFKENNEEFPLKDKDSKVVYIPKSQNKYCFKVNTVNNNSNDNNNIKEEILNPEKTKILFIKKYDPVNKNIILEKIIDITLEDNENDLETFASIASNFQKPPSEFIIERTCSYVYKDKNSNDNFPLLTPKNAYSILSLVTSLILIPIYKSDNILDEIYSHLNLLYYTLYVDVSTFQFTRLIKKMRIDLKAMSDEHHLRECILKQLKEKKLLTSLIPIKDHYYINQSHQMLLLTEDLLKDMLTSDNIELFDDSDPTQKQSTESKDFKILSLLNQYECKFVFKLTLYKAEDLSDNYFQEIYLYNIYNNEVCLISAIVPKKLKRCCDVLEYLYDILQRRFGCFYMKKNYYFILQNKSHSFAYQIITEGKIELKLYENKAKDIEYRLQPYLDNDIRKFNNPEYKKVFISYEKLSFGYIFPMVLFFKNNERFSEIKAQIENMIQKSNYYDRLIQEKGKLDIKIYKAIIANSKMIKENKEPIKKEDSLDSIYKSYSNAINLYVEFVKSCDI